MPEKLKPGYVQLKTPGFREFSLNPGDRLSTLITYSLVLRTINEAKMAFEQNWNIGSEDKAYYMQFVKNSPKVLSELHILVPQLDQWQAEDEESIRRMTHQRNNSLSTFNSIKETETIS